jgi:hypothetical protein
VRLGVFVLASAVCLVSACTLFTPLDTNLTSGDPGTAVTEAGPDVETGAVTEGGGGPPDSSDASVDGDGDAALIDAGPTKCTQPGDVVRPIRAFDATPAAVGAGTHVCNVDAVFIEDGIVAGMDRVDANYASIDGQGIVSCIGVEMAPGVVIDHVLVRAQAVQSACGGMCMNTGCDTGHSFPIYVGTSETDLVMAANGNDVSTTLSKIDVAAPTTISARFVVVCRSTWGLERDDIAIDSIAATCR